jgi:hypothetical protein
MKTTLSQLKRAKRILVCGDRHYYDVTLIEFYLEKISSDAVIIHGAARGADLLAEECARKLQLDYMGFPARWKQHGKAAGPIRNNRMLDIGKPDFVLAFHNDIKRSKGTAHMISQARKRGIPVMIISR